MAHMIKRYWTRCRYCQDAIVFFKYKDKMIPVNLNTIALEERISLEMDIPVPFDPMVHRKHFETCTKRTNQH